LSLRPGQEIRIGEIIIRIVEVIPYRTITGKRHYLIAYNIRDRDYQSPTAHIWIAEGESPAKKFEAVVKYYLEVVRGIRR